MSIANGFGDPKQRISELERQLAEVTRERDEVIADAAKFASEAFDAEAQLAASQAREQQLQGALEKIVEPPSEPVLAGLTRLRMLAGGALALPTDDTALRAWGAKLLREKAAWFDEHDTDAAEHLRRKADELEAQFK